MMLRGALIGLITILLWSKASSRGILLVSSPSTRCVYYSVLPSFHDLSLPVAQRPAAPSSKVLIDGVATKCSGGGCSETSDHGLEGPEGLALWQGPRGNILFVSDPQSTSIYAYELALKGPDSARTIVPSSTKESMVSFVPLEVGRQRRIRTGVNASWLAVDGQGNLFYTTSNGTIEMISADRIASDSARDITASVLYSAKSHEVVSGPAGIAADGSLLFWANSEGGGTSGVVAKAPASLQNASAGNTTISTVNPKSIAANGARAFGVCLARGNVFYTANGPSLYAVKRTGGAISEVTQGFFHARGCSFDGDGTIYVVDAGGNNVFSLPAVSNLRAVRHHNVVATVEGPSQVVVFSAVGGHLRGEALRSGAVSRYMVVAYVVAVASVSCSVNLMQ